MNNTRRIKDFPSDTGGISTVIDIFLFLVMVSISAVILLPAITGNTQIKSAIESKNQKHSSQVLLTLLNGRIDEFEYTVAGEQMDAAAGYPVNNSSVYLEAKRLIAGHELKHRTFADLAAENAATQWTIYHNGKKIRLNFLMNDYSGSLDDILERYLEEQIGDRYYYNFTVVWHPFTGVPIGGDVSIGEQTPKNAYTESTFITMPYHVNFTRERVEGIMNSSSNGSNISAAFDELKKNGTNRTLVEEMISNEVKELINRTAEEIVADIVVSALEPVLDRGRSTMNKQVDNLLPNGSILLNTGINNRINTTLREQNASSNGTMAAKLTLYLQETAKHEIHEKNGDEIRILVTELTDLYVNGAITITGMRERIVEEVFSRISVSRAQVTLSVWERNA